MIKRADSPYVPGRPKGLWCKWKRDPLPRRRRADVRASAAHGKRSSFYSDYTFGVWRAGPDGDELVPVGKAYFGFTDEELLQLDRYVRNHTINRFGPVREVAYGKDKGLVLEVAFEGLQRSTRHKSGVAMRFPRIHRIRWDKPPRGGRPHRGAGEDPGARRGRDLPAGGQRMRASMSRSRSVETTPGRSTRQAAGRLVVETRGPGFTEITDEVAPLGRGSAASATGCSPSSAATPRPR